MDTLYIHAPEWNLNTTISVLEGQKAVHAPSIGYSDGLLVALSSVSVVYDCSILVHACVDNMLMINSFYAGKKVARFVQFLDILGPICFPGLSVLFPISKGSILF
jgi:hypothetical protein